MRCKPYGKCKCIKNRFNNGTLEQNIANYNAQNVASYNANNIATYNANNIASYNAAQAGNVSGALGVYAPGAPASNTPSQPGSYTPATETLSTGTVISDSVIVVDDASIFDVNAMIEVTGDAFGGMSIDTIYYVLAVDAINNEISLSLSEGGPAIILTNETPVNPDMLVKWASVNLQQYVETNAEFAIQAVMGGYTAAITNAGSGYAVDNVITILGTDLGGTSPNNDCVIIVNAVDTMGGITSIIRQGTPATAENDYYLKVVSENQLAVASDVFSSIGPAKSNMGENVTKSAVERLHQIYEKIQ